MSVGKLMIRSHLHPSVYLMSRLLSTTQQTFRMLIFINYRKNSLHRTVSVPNYNWDYDLLAVINKFKKQKKRFLLNDDDFMSMNVGIEMTARICLYYVRWENA
ncbi:CLUMA_CG017872, isoform A [Clunio marinus]|uniref:CLUMA_CG017872, isoform A n=1 Tax=Clunio marinus TaxID=568069 RepID=A0A1J1IX12_9DIPT|nr:CLUMA_CG017872, isoform A [Clunio marinus]